METQRNIQHRSTARIFKNKLKTTTLQTQTKLLCSTKTNWFSFSVGAALFFVMVKTVPVWPGSTALVFMVVSAWGFFALIFMSGVSVIPCTIIVSVQKPEKLRISDHRVHRFSKYFFDVTSRNFTVFTFWVGSIPRVVPWSTSDFSFCVGEIGKSDA